MMEYVPTGAPIVGRVVGTVVFIIGMVVTICSDDGGPATGTVDTDLAMDTVVTGTCSISGHCSGGAYTVPFSLPRKEIAPRQQQSNKMQEIKTSK